MTRVGSSVLVKNIRPGRPCLYVDCAKPPTPFSGVDRRRTLERVPLVEVEGVVHPGFRQERGVHVD